MSNCGLQSHFLSELKQEKLSVSIFLVSGIKLQGVILDFDDTAIELGNTVVQLVYKHAISSIVPERNLETIHAK